MAVRIDGIFKASLKEAINKCKLLVVGAGGIGCELLKTLVLTGFEDIHVIDLDTIDLSNLNRQFLFHKQHIGKPKAIVAKESVLKFNPKANITAYHDSITSTEYSVQFYRQFTAVCNALDNVAARSHVNRMCMAADIPLIESGSAGYLGQITVYKRKATECYECLPRKTAKSYAGCTIRNTPSLPVHCIVWAKHLFVQLFGEADAEEEVSPDVNDPELAGKEYVQNNTARQSTREWAQMVEYDPEKIFEKLFVEDINYLLSMHHLWEERRPPVPIKYSDLPDAVASSSHSAEEDIRDCNLWTLKQCGEVFKDTVTAFYKKMKENPDAVFEWDKDDEECLNFVAACANLRSHCFDIEQKSKFDIKAIAGNIIPAIATTNAVVGGLIVLQLLKLLKGRISDCRSSWLTGSYQTSNKVISSAQLEKPNPKCFVCSTAQPDVKIKVNVETMNLRTLNEKILKEKMLMVQPDVFKTDGTATILISSDPEEMSDDMFDKTLSHFSITTDTRLACEDYFQNFKFNLHLSHDPEITGQDFILESDIENVQPNVEVMNNNASTSKEEDDDDDEDCIMEDNDILIAAVKKRPTEEDGNEPPYKKIRSTE